mgnify:CR=1 FL=1
MIGNDFTKLVKHNLSIKGGDAPSELKGPEIKQWMDKEETKKFVKDTLGNLSGGDEFSDEAFDEVFATFDKDGSGTVEKAEMVVFIKQLLG